MKAFQLIEQGAPGRFELRDVPSPEPAAGEVTIQVEACGLNHLDLWLEKKGLPVPITLPRTPGGEVSGRVLKLGPSVHDWKPGDEVAVQSNLFCGECEFCRAGEESICLKGELLGVNRDGGFAEEVVVPARSLVRLPPGVDFKMSAALTLAASTAMHMLTDRTRVRAGEWVLVMGAASGVGSAAIQIATALGARVISTASSDEKRRLGLSLGAVAIVDLAQPGWTREVRQITGKRGVDLVIEHIGGKVLEQSFETLVRGGRVVTCGATAGRELPLNLWPFFVKQHQLIGSYGRTRRDMAETLQWAAAGKLKPVIDSVVGLSETGQAFQKLHSRKALGKVLVVPRV